MFTQHLWEGINEEEESIFICLDCTVVLTPTGNNWKFHVKCFYAFISGN